MKKKGKKEHKGQNKVVSCLRLQNKDFIAVVVEANPH